MTDEPGTTPPFGQLLLEYRGLARLTQEELAAASGVSVRAISDMERGRSRAPQRKTVEALAAGLGLADDERVGLVRAARAGRSSRRRGGEPSSNAVPTTGACDLPCDIGDFTGREPELAWLRVLGSKAATGSTGTTVISTTSGQAGVGKTTLAVRAGYALAEEFPDGRFYIELRGMDDRPVDPGEALARLLRALGVDDSRIPQGTEERAGLYRSLLRSRRIFIVLDNAGTEAQVRPLLPASPTCLVLITSRRMLLGLESVDRVLLDVMRPAEAVALLGQIVGPDRCAVEAEAAEVVARLCGYLPLALRIAGNRLATRPGWSIARLAGQLRDEQRRLALLTAGDLQIRAAFVVSYQRLPEAVRSVFRRLSLVPGADFGVEIAALLADLDLTAAEAVLEDLVDASLLELAPVPCRYRFHDLVRLFARDQLNEEEAASQRQAVEERMMSWLLDAAVRAGRCFDPDHQGAPGHDDALRWLDTECLNWFAAACYAASRSWHRAVVDLAEAMHWYSDLRFYRDPWTELFELAVSAARQLGSQGEEAVHLNHLAWALRECTGRNEESLDCSLRALSLARAVEDRREEAGALGYAARTYLSMGEFDQAERYFQQAIAVFRDIHDPFGESVALRGLGEVLRQCDRVDQAFAIHQRIVAIYREPASPVSGAQRPLSLVKALLDVGRDLHELRRWDEAVEHFRQALSVARVIHYRSGEGFALYLMGRALHKLHSAEARSCLEQALAVFVDTSEHLEQAQVRRTLDELGDSLGP